MNIITDIRPLLEPDWSGVSWYTYYLIDSLLKIDRKNQYFLFYNQFKINKLFHCFIVSLLQKIFCRWENHQFNQAIVNWRQYPNVKIVDCHYPNKIFNLSMRFFKYPKIDQLVKKTANETMKQWVNETIFFAPNLNFIALSKTVKLILTIHDLSFKIFPEFFSSQMRLWHWLIKPKKLCQQAEKIIAISENTKNDLKDIYDLNSDKIKVIYPGLDPGFKIITDQEKLKQTQKKYSLPAKFILTAGTLEPRKNIEAVIRAFELLCQSQPALRQDLNLVVAGGRGWKCKKILTLWQKSALSAKIKIIKAGHQDLPAIYNSAQVLLYLSFYEGFGLPPLEAMACGLPVVASYAPALPEVLADSALLVDPHNISETVFALKQILSNDDLRQNLIKKGLARAGQFNWEKTADQVLRLTQCRDVACYVSTLGYIINCSP